MREHKNNNGPRHSILIKLAEGNGEILRILSFGLLGVVERAADHFLAVDDHDLVVSDRVFTINVNRHSVMGEICSSGVSLFGLALVQNHHDIDATLLASA